VAPRVRIHDVAKAAGVSVTTVSHTLNGKGRLTEETRRRVRSVAEELGYRPNSSARHLKGGTAGILGISLSQAASNPVGMGDFGYFMKLHGAASAAAVDLGFALALTAARGPDEDRPNPVDRMPLDGGIVIDPVTDDPDVRRLRRRGIPVVTTGRVPGEPADQGTWIDNNHDQAIRRILAHFARRGATRVGLITSEPVTTYTADTLAGYRAWCAEAGAAEIVATTANPTEVAGHAAAVQLFDRADPPDALYCTLDHLALGALLAAREREIAIPGQLLIAACTDSEESRRVQPALTAVDLQPEEVGRRAVELLVALVEQREAEPRQLVPTILRTRGSTR
jgi:DNA-binding LacI/PurR family transcriptional regulator